MPGDSVSFVVIDPDVGKSRDNSTALPDSATNRYATAFLLFLSAG